MEVVAKKTGFFNCNVFPVQPARTAGTIVTGDLRQRLVRQLEIMGVRDDTTVRVTARVIKDLHVG